MAEGALGIASNYISKQGYHDSRTRLVGWKESLPLALDMALLMSMSTNTKPFKALETKMAAVEGKISIDLQVVNTRLKELLTPEPVNGKDTQIITQKEE